MFCVECGKNADYIFEGCSLCAFHYNNLKENSKKYENLFYIEQSKYRGTVSMLFKFFNELQKTKPNIFMTFKIKYAMLKKINMATTKLEASKINDTIGLILSRSNVTFDALIACLYQKNKKVKDTEIVETTKNLLDEVKKTADKYKKTT